jgi:succinoglycan biosynthesis transport protein ExoP
MPEENEATLDLRGYLRVLRRWKGTILLATILVVGAAIGLTLRQTPVYEATANILLQTSLSEQATAPDVLTEADQNSQGLSTEIAVANSRSTRLAVREKLGRSPNASISGVGDTSVLAVHSRSTDAEQAADDANGYANAYIDLRLEQRLDQIGKASTEIQRRIEELAAQPPTERIATEIEQLQGQLRGLQAASNITDAGATLISEAVVPGSPVSPKPVRNAIAGFGIGLVLGIGLAFLREYLDETVKSKEALERATGLTVLGLIPAVPDWKDRKTARVIAASDPRSAAAEAYRTLRTSLQFMALERPMKTLQVTSASAMEGKTTTIANLAVTFARADQRVIVVCCDLRRPRIHEFFGLTNDVGFTSVLLGETPLSEAIQSVKGASGIALVASGPPPPNPSELLASRRSAEVLAALESRCDLMLVDSAPVVPVTDALVLAGMVDATLLVADASSTTKRGLHRAVELLGQVDAQVVGTVLNGASPSTGYYGYGGDETYYVADEAGVRNGRRGRKRAEEPVNPLSVSPGTE